MIPGATSRLGTNCVAGRSRLTRSEAWEIIGREPAGCFDISGAAAGTQIMKALLR